MWISLLISYHKNATHFNHGVLLMSFSLIVRFLYTVKILETEV